MKKILYYIITFISTAGALIVAYLIFPIGKDKNYEKKKKKIANTNKRVSDWLRLNPPLKPAGK